MANESNLRKVASQMAERYGVDSELFARLITKESNWDVDAKGNAGEIGLTQILAKTGIKPGFGVTPIQDRSDPVENLRFGAEYLAALVRYFDGDYAKALMAYNGGHTNVEKGTVTSGAKNYANSLLSGKSGTSNFDPGTSDPGQMGRGLTEPPMSLSGKSTQEVMKMIDDFFKTPNVSPPNVSSGIFKTTQMGGMSPLTGLNPKVGIPNVGAVRQYSTPDMRQIVNPAMSGIQTLKGE